MLLLAVQCCGQFSPCSLTEGYRCCAWRCIQNLLGSCVQDVYLCKYNTKSILKFHWHQLYENLEMSGKTHQSPCWSMYRGAPPIEATESTRNRQLYLKAQIRTLQPSSVCVLLHVLGQRGSYLWHSCPIPSKGCKTPVDDSPCARKNSAGLCFSKAWDETAVGLHRLQN